MHYAIFNKKEELIGRLFFDDEVKECLFRGECSGDVRDQFAAALQLEGVGNYEGALDGSVICNIGDFKILIDYASKIALVENLKIGMNSSYLL